MPLLRTAFGEGKHRRIMDEKESGVLMGRIAGPYGVKGWLRIHSYAEPPENIFTYGEWSLRERGNPLAVRAATPLDGKKHGKGLVARIAGIDDRDKAEALKGLGIYVARSRLPKLDDGNYYWADLEGLRVENLQEVFLGHVDHMMEAGAADVMVVCGEDGGKRRCLIPFIKGDVVLKVDLDSKLITVDWEDDSGQRD
jgi:16S rRNA processing protein RimM